MKRLQIPQKLVYEIAALNLSKIYFLKTAKKTCKPNNCDSNRDWNIFDLPVTPFSLICTHFFNKIFFKTIWLLSCLFNCGKQLLCKKFMAKTLTCFMPLIPLYTPWKHLKTRSSLVFSGGMEKEQWPKTGKLEM